LPQLEKARIEVYLPDASRPAYQDLLAALEVEFSYTFGGCTTMRGLEGNYLSIAGTIIRDRISLVYTDTPFEFNKYRELIAEYTGELRQAALLALDEEAIVVVVAAIHHAD